MVEARADDRAATTTRRLHDVDGRRRHKAGMTYGATDELGYHAADKPVHVHDLHATILHLLGFDHKKLTFRYARPRLPPDR